MPIYTTRIELHKSTDNDYENLHAAMAKEGFTKTIIVNKVTYKMPTAEYNFEGTETAQEVFNKAEKAAKSTNKSYWILLTESVQRIFLLNKN